MCKIMEKMKKIIFFGVLFLVYQTAAENVIYKLSDEDYSRMPPKNHLDRYHLCLAKRNAVYCTAHADLVSDGPSELLDMIRGYSAHITKHFNYTYVVRGLCLTGTCRHFYNGSDDEADMRVAAEACLNSSFSAEYGLKTRVTELNCYYENKGKFTTDWVDWSFALLMFAILALNVAGTVYDAYKDPTKPENVLLMAFSLRANWKQLRAPPSTDPKMALLKPFHAIRAITSILVILGHTPISAMIAIDNTRWKESALDVPAYHILIQGHLITLTFFMLSGFLLAYNSLIVEEKAKLKWTVLPRAVLNRWLRISPINIVCLLLTCTLMRFTPYGPFWQEMIGEEIHDCRHYWFHNLFYTNNLVDHSQCILQTWYLACDVQLHIIGLAVMLLAPSARARWRALGALYAVGLAWPAYNIYSMDLHGSLLATPNVMSEFFIKDPTFNYVYKRTHANMPIFIIGMAFGFLVYDWNKKNVFAKDLTKYRYLYWTLFPLLLLLVTSGGHLFFQDGPRASLLTRLLFAPIVRPLFVTLVMLIILGAMFKIENFQRGILEWSGWMPLSRISYCVFAFHVGVIRYLGGTRPTLMHFSLFHLMHDYCGVIIMTLIVALVFYLLVEAPFANLVRVFMASVKNSKPAVSDNAVNGAVNGAAVAVNGTAVDCTKINGAAVSCNGLNGTAVHETAPNGTAINGHTMTEPMETHDKDKNA